MKKSIIKLLLVSCFCTSCSDFLTENPRHSMTAENAVTSYSGAVNIVNGIYGVYQTRGSYLGGQLYGALYCMAGLWEYNSTMYNMGYSQSAVDYTITSTWSAIYGCINAANAAIEGISSLDVSNYPSEEEKNRLLAEARCFRGYCNLELMWLFARWFDSAESPYGIIYRDKSAELSNLMVGRSTVGQSYQYIIDDLSFAAQHLGDYDSARRMSKQFAQFMLAKMYLVRGWEGDYAESLKLVNAIFDGAPATFQMETDLTNLYANGWESKEVLFSRYLGDRMGDYSGMSGSEFIYSYALFYDHEFTEIPQKWLEDDARASIFLGTARAPETWDTQTKEKVLVKLYHRGRYEGKNDMYATYPCRYAELYLMKAELLARTNPSNIEAALKPLNDMREKYTNPVLEKISVNSYEELMDAIFKEYVVTLFMENETPWFASLRFTKDGKPWINSFKPDVNFSSNQYCWPIPDDEIKSHSNKIEQNPGLE